MGFVQNLNQTLDSAGPEKTPLEPTSQLSPVAVDAILALGVLTFALQLCVVLYFLFRCWRLDNHVQKTLKQNISCKNKLLATPLKRDLLTQIRHSQCESTAPLSTVTSDLHQHYEPVKSDLFGPSMPWDLFQLRP